MNKHFLERNAVSILGLETTKKWSCDHSYNFEPEDGKSITSNLEAIYIFKVKSICFSYLRYESGRMNIGTNPLISNVDARLR